MDTVLRGLKWHICLCYLDDILVYSSDFDSHLVRLRQVLSVLRDAGLQINLKKCHFAARQIKVLGHVVSADGIRPDPDKIAAVQQFPCLTSVKTLQSFLGLCSYFRRFIPNFTHRASPLYALLVHGVPFSWTRIQESAFQDLKSYLTQSPLLAHFNPRRLTIVHTDASSCGLGAVLLQRDRDVERPVAFASRSLSRPESNYSTSERECLAIVWAIQKFRPYLYGRPFRVVTDHHSLCWLKSIKDPTGRLARWSLRLQEYDFEITYKSGKKHLDADSLSRCPLPSVVSAILEPRSLADLSTLQLADAFAGKILRFLAHPSDPSSAVSSRQRALWSRLYFLRHGLLYRRGATTSAETFHFVVPKCLQPLFIEFEHDNPTAGHLGFTKTYQRLRSRFYWPGMQASVAQYVRSCDVCQRHKVPKSSPPATLQPILPPLQPFECVGLDYLGPFPFSDSGNRYILVSVDYLTRFAETKAVPAATSLEAATFFLQRVVLRHGSPARLISDRGSHFTAAMFQECLRLCQTIHRKATPYHPQTNGLVERFNHTLSHMLASFVNSTQTNWDLVLPFVTYAYNTSVQSTHGYTPFRLVYGREASSPLDRIFPVGSSSSHPFLSEYCRAADLARLHARQRISDHQLSQTLRRDSSRPPLQFEVGALVWQFIPLRRIGLSEKLLERFFGPYKITRKLGPVTYEVETMHSDPARRKRDLTHVSRLKPYYSRAPEAALLPGRE